MQQFAPGILGYFTASEWDNLLATRGVVAAPMATEKLFNRIFQLSCRNLSEPSLTVVPTSCFVSCMEKKAM